MISALDMREALQTLTESSIRDEYEIIHYNGFDIEIDPSYIEDKCVVHYCSDDYVFDNVKEAKEFIDEINSYDVPNYEKPEIEIETGDIEFDTIEDAKKFLDDIDDYRKKNESYLAEANNQDKATQMLLSKLRELIHDWREISEPLHMICQRLKVIKNQSLSHI